MADPTLAAFEKLDAQSERTADGESDPVAHKVDQLFRLQSSIEGEDNTRIILAIIIAALYSLTVLITLIWLGTRIPQTASANTLDPYSNAMLDILKSIILPVVTFMLGFYFGTGAVSRNPGSVAPAKPAAKPKPTGGKR